MLSQKLIEFFVNSNFVYIIFTLVGFSLLKFGDSKNIKESLLDSEKKLILLIPFYLLFCVILNVVFPLTKTVGIIVELFLAFFTIISVYINRKQLLLNRKELTLYLLFGLTIFNSILFIIGHVYFLSNKIVINTTNNADIFVHEYLIRQHQSFTFLDNSFCGKKYVIF